MAEIKPARLVLHYSSGIGYWAKLDGEDMNIYATPWHVFARELGEALARTNPLHPGVDERVEGDNDE